MKFRFRLERILHFVLLKEKVKKTEVASIAQRIALLERRKRELMDGNLKLLTQQLERLGVDLTWLPFQADKIQWNKKELTQIEKLVLEANELLAEKRQELLKVAMRRKSLEALKEKRKTDWRMEQARKEQKNLDENYHLAQEYNKDV